jgi:transcriptional antiterminator RfaH
MKRWYCAHTAPNQEARALVNLRRQGFEAWLPRCTLRRCHTRRGEDAAIPLFSGYLFVAFNRELDCWRSINGTFGCHYLIMNGEQPAPLPDGLVESLMANSDAAGLVSIRSPLNSLSPGVPVSILYGPFAELVSQLESAENDMRVSLLLEVLGRKVDMRLPAVAVEAA